MLKSPGFTDHQNVLEMDLLGVRRGWDGGIHGRLILRQREACEDQKR
jgi:hypothetical protein